MLCECVGMMGVMPMMRPPGMMPAMIPPGGMIPPGVPMPPFRPPSSQVSSNYCIMISSTFMMNMNNFLFGLLHSVHTFADCTFSDDH